MTNELPHALCLRWHKGRLIRRWLTADTSLLWCSVCECFR